MTRETTLTNLHDAVTLFRALWQDESGMDEEEKQNRPVQLALADTMESSERLILTLHAENERLREALTTAVEFEMTPANRYAYLSHGMLCDLEKGTGACSCGLAAWKEQTRAAFTGGHP